MKPFLPHHINATIDDLAGNNGLGRYILLPGSDGRAQEIANHFQHLIIKKHDRGHHLYLGTLATENKIIDVATVSSGMGCPSMEIILHELFNLGATRFLRVGTAGSLQPDRVKLGDIINAQASVRDESTTTDYVPLTFPAISSYELLDHILTSTKKLGMQQRVHTGVVHCKSSFYARQYGNGPQGVNNMQYIQLLSQCGVLASEMETATLFIQAQLYNQLLKNRGDGLQNKVIAGALLGIISAHQQIADAEIIEQTTQSLIHLALETIKTLAQNECISKN